MSDQPAIYDTVQSPVVEKYITFTLNDGQWNIQLWPTGYRPLTGKVYRLRIVVPAELVGQTVEATVEPVS